MSFAPPLTNDRVLEIRRRVAAGETQAVVARSMGIGRATVSRWVGHDRMPVLATPTKAEIALRKAEALEMKRADPRLGALACAGRLDVHQTTVTVWWQEAGLMPERLGQPDRPDDPFIDLLEVEYDSIDVSEEWRRVGLRRWAYVPPRAAATSGMATSEWVA